MHGGQREPGIPEPHEAGHVRERPKEVRVTPGKGEEIRAAVSTVPEPVTPLNPNRGHGEAAAAGPEQAPATLASQAERNTERSGVFLALETKFLLFWT